MEKRAIKINGTEKQVSLLGFGLMRLPTISNAHNVFRAGDIDKEKALKMVQYAVENGVNYLDTAWPYHDGKSELFVKDILKVIDREKVYLATKLPIWDCKSKEDVERIFHEQLKKCGVEYFDFYLIHAVNKNRVQQVIDLDLMKTLEKFKEEGKIRNIGFSFHDDMEGFKKWIDFYPWDFVQIQLNYMDIEHQQGIEGYHMLTERNIPVVIMEPIKGGSLAKFNDTVEKKLKDLDPEASIASWAFRWVGSLPNVKVILSGMSTFEQVEDNIKTFSNFKPMTNDENKLMEEVRSDLLSLTKVDCTSCNYCMPCPHGVDIPGNFRAYNGHVMYQNDRRLKWQVKEMKKQDKFANACINCGECEPKCPQFIEIPLRLEEFQNYLSDNGLD